MLAISLDEMEDSMGVGVAGVLGMPALSNLKLTLDYQDGTARLERRKN